MFQWENSVHALGGHYARNTTACAVCHTSQGFLERIETGAQETVATIDDPLPQNCYTCHQIHNTYTEADWALTASEPVTLWEGGETRDIGKGNQCINCHQARIAAGLPVPGVAGTTNITSSYWGPHHGAQGTLFTGAGGYKVEGSVAYANSAHTALVEDACITCHMAPVSGGRESGGHTFRVESESGSLNTNGCVQCHTDGANAVKDLVAATQTEIEDLLAQLADKLVAKGIFDANHKLQTGDWDNVVVGSAYNYIFIEEDKSAGVHNAKYVRALLINSIEALQ
jgi:hypothetical protein